MSIQIKSLSNPAPVRDDSLAAPLDTYNIIPTANQVYDIYTAPNDTTNNKSTIVKSVRLANIKAQTVAISLYYNRPNASGQNRRRLLTPEGLAMLANSTYIDDGEITLEPGDKIQLKADVANAIQYVLSGVEREVT